MEKATKSCSLEAQNLLRRQRADIQGISDEQTVSKVCVQVAVRVRPLLPREVLHKHQVCVRVVPGNHQVLIGTNRTFDFDNVFGPVASQDEVFESCVQPLVRAMVEGHNATVLAYGQTGSGKTHTLGSGHLAFLPDEEGGIIGRVAQDMFSLLREKKQRGGCVEAKLRVSYMELYREELRDLLELHINHKVLHIREDDRGNTVVVGAKETSVTSAEELLSILEAGNALRQTGTTAMNERSSRSHAILTLRLTQHCHDNSSGTNSFHFSKLHLVDLAGSERAAKTGNTGTRFKESVYINTGLLALGNVIHALSDHGRIHRGNSSANTHVPYRDSKLTRLLRDSLGGTAHTLMVACVSPSHHSMAETLSVLQFANRARHIRNRPGAMFSCIEAKSCPTTWDPGEARLTELECELQILRAVLREKEREMKKEKAGNGASRQEDGSKQPNGIDRLLDSESSVSERKAPQYHSLAHEAAALMEDISTFTLNSSLKQQLKDWRERFLTVSHSNLNDKKDNLDIDDDDEPHHVTILQLRRKLNKCKEALVIDKQELEQKDEALRQLQKEIKKIVKESKTHLSELEVERERTRIQTEQLVDQQILIKRLRCIHTSSGPATLGTSEEVEAAENSSRRPHSVPLLKQHRGHRTERKIHMSPPAYSLERVIAAFKMRGHLLLAEIEEKYEVYCPFLEPREEQDDDDDEGTVGFKRSLKCTWIKESSTGPNHESKNGSKSAQFQLTKGSKHATHSNLKKVGASAIQRRILELSANMRMKEELIKELDKTDKQVQEVDRSRGDSREAGMLARLSLQSQQAREELFQSLQHMILQRAKLQTRLQQESNKEPEQNRELRIEDMSLHQSQQCEDSKEKERDSSWLGAEEEQAMQRRAELRELEEEIKGRKEALQRREACLQLRNRLETKRLHSSQALNQDLLRVSAQLESLEELLEGSSHGGQTGGVGTEELEKERDSLRNRRDALNARLKDGRLLTAQEEQSLHQMVEAIEAIDAALEFKNQSIQDKQHQLFSCQSAGIEPAQLCDVTGKLKKLSLGETTDLLVKYFNKVVRLREEEHCLRLCCEELLLSAEEQERLVRKMEAAMQRLVLDADQRLTQQQRENQTTIQLLLQQLKEGGSGEAEQAAHAKLQLLEKELVFYRSSSRELKKELKKLLTGYLQPSQELDAPSSHTQKLSKKCYVQLNTEANDCKTHSDAIDTKTHNKIHTKQSLTKSDKQEKISKILAQTEQLLGEKHQRCPSSSYSLKTNKKVRIPAHHQMQAQTQGRKGSGNGHVVEGIENKTIRLSRRELKEISPADLKVSPSAAGQRYSIVKTSTESRLEDSIEMARND